MTRRSQEILNRGRFQAQGDGLEKSRAWAMTPIPTKTDGRVFIQELKDLLTPSELAVRRTCFEKALRWIDNSPSKGYIAVTPIKATFKISPPKRDIRVDGEIFRGTAFIDEVE